MKKYHQQNLVEHEADSAVRECRTQSLSKLVGVHDQDRRMVWLWAAWATTGKSNFGLRAAYAKLTRSLRGCAGTTTQKPVRLCQVRIHHTSNTPKNLIKKTIQSELTPPLRQQCWQKMLTQAYAHQCFAYATSPYKDPKTKHKHRGLERGSNALKKITKSGFGISQGRPGSQDSGSYPYLIPAQMFSYIYI